MMTTLWIIQASMDTRGADVLQYIISAALIATVTVGCKMALDINTIKTVLLHPDTGIMTEVSKLRNASHDFANLMIGHAFAINRAESAAGLEPTEGLHPKRRTDLNG